MRDRSFVDVVFAEDVSAADEGLCSLGFPRALPLLPAVFIRVPRVAAGQGPRRFVEAYAAVWWCVAKSLGHCCKRKSLKIGDLCHSFLDERPSFVVP